MNITFDAAKNERNIVERGLSFELAAMFDFDTATFEVDNRKNYGEERITACGLLFDIPYVLIFTVRGEEIRVISFRKANKREIRRYEQATRP